MAKSVGQCAAAPARSPDRPGNRSAARMLLRSLHGNAPLSVMKSGLEFLVAAKQCEIGELEQLALVGDLVQATARLIHALQRERGLSNLYLGSHGHASAAARRQQIAACQAAEAAVRERFEQLDRDAANPGNGARLFSRIAYVLHGLDALPALRRRIDHMALPPAQSTAAFGKLIAGLLAVVFEAADSATDPEVSRLLVAMFNFMQGKEFAGQERALGAAVFSTALRTPADEARLHQLIERQQACAAVFLAFAGTETIALAEAARPATAAAEHERLRRVLAQEEPRAWTPQRGLSPAWYDCCTQLIDAMRTVEERLADDLLRLCRHKTALAQADLAAYRRLLPGPVPGAAVTAPVAAADFFDDEEPGAGRREAALASAADGFGPHLERSIFDLLREQTQRLQSMRDELESARAALHERKLVERAKGLLMARRQLSEEEAHRTLRQMAMNQNRRLVEVAETVLALAEPLVPRTRPHR